MITKDSIDCEQATDKNGNHYFVAYSDKVARDSDLEDLKWFIIDWCEEYIDASPNIEIWYETQGPYLTVHCLDIFFDDDTEAMAFKLRW